MCAVLPVDDERGIDELQIRLVYQSRSLQRVTGILSAHVMVSQAVQFSIYQRHQPIKRCLVSVTPSYEQLSYFMWWICRHSRTRRQWRTY